MMMGPKIFTEDLEIARRLIQRDGPFTRDYFYKKCYPLFKSIYDSYYTDCADCLEFIHEIYVVVLAPGKKTGHCQMENFRGESTLQRWLKSTCILYCIGRFKKRIPTTDIEKAGDRKPQKEESIEPALEGLTRSDVERMIGQIKPPRYSLLMKLRYLEHHTNKETAKLLGMTMKNYYNKHKLAKDQLAQIMEKEGCYGK